MLMPNRTKYRKVRKGRVNGVATRGERVAFGQYALQSLENERLTARQIEAGGSPPLNEFDLGATQPRSFLFLQPSLDRWSS